MNDNDLNEMIKKAQSMIQNNQIPDDIKSLINNLQNSNNNTSSNVNNTYRNNSYNYSSSNNQKNNSNYNYSNNKYNSNNNSSNSSYNNNNFNNGNYNTEKKYNNSNYQNSSQVSNNKNFSNDNEKSDLNSITSNIDMETLMKIQNIMSKMKNSDNDDMSKLLLSLKPYLRDGRKEKIDEYIQLIKMGKMTQFLDLFGGDKK